VRAMLGARLPDIPWTGGLESIVRECSKQRAAELARSAGSTAAP